MKHSFLDCSWKPSWSVRYITVHHRKCTLIWPDPVDRNIVHAVLRDCLHTAPTTYAPLNWMADTHYHLDAGDGVDCK